MSGMLGRSRCSPLPGSSSRAGSRSWLIRRRSRPPSAPVLPPSSSGGDNRGHLHSASSAPAAIADLHRRSLPARRAAVREQARQTSSQLRVLSVHFEDNAASLAAGGDAGAGLALQRADDDLNKALQQAPWITPQQGSHLLNNLHGLEA